MKTLTERFWNKVNKTENGCWIWIARKNKKGYGQFHSINGVVLSHRLSWELNNGKIPDGFHVLHHCDNPSCVNPNHLFLGTEKDNAHDREIKCRGKQASGEKNGKSKLTWESVIKIRDEYRYGNGRKLAQKYSVDPRTISSVITFRCWRTK